MVDDTDGHPLDVGRKQRTVSTALKRALYARDRGCSFPGCDRTRYLDAHHLEHWADGGETNLPNLTLLCTHHHRALHEGGFQAERDAHGALRFRRADGRAIPRCGYRLEDFTDDGVDDVADDGAKDVSGNCLGDRDFDDTSRPSREGFRTTMVQRPEAEVREPQGVYAVCRLTPRRPIKPAA